MYVREIIEAEMSISDMARRKTIDEIFACDNATKMCCNLGSAVNWTMMQSVTQTHGQISGRPFLSALTSLNEQRRNDALYLLAREYEKPLTPFKKRVEINWFDVLDGAEQIEQTDCSYARAMLGLWV